MTPAGRIPRALRALPGGAAVVMGGVLAGPAGAEDDKPILAKPLKLNGLVVRLSGIPPT